MDIVGMCGITCSACPAFVATQSWDAAAIAAIAAQWGQQFGAEIPPESIWCDGCTTAGERKCGHCAECAVRACGLARGVSTCAACDDYGCETLMGFIQHVPKARETLEALRHAGE